MSSLEAFIDSLTKEKDKLVQLGTLKTSRNHALATFGSKNGKSKGKKKIKEKKPKSDDEDEGSNSIDRGSKSKMKSKKKGSSKCSYCNKGFHSKKSCFKKKMHTKTQFLERHNIDVPNFVRKKKPKKNMLISRSAIIVCTIKVMRVGP